MRPLALYTIFTGALLTVGLSATGCIEEKVEIDLQADGSGKLTVERTLGKQISSFMLMSPDGPKKNAAKGLAAYEGIDAWTNIETETTKDGRVRFSATGWFKDLSKVGQTSDKSSTSYELEREGDTLHIGFKQTSADDGGGAPGMGGKKSLFDHSAEELPQVKAMTKGMLTGMLAGFKMQYSFRLPGKPTETNNFKQDPEDPNRVSIAFDGEMVSDMIDLMFEETEALRPKVDAGELTKEEAEAEVKKRVQAKFELKNGPNRVSCTVAGAEADPKFVEAFRAAKNAWRESQWRGAVEEAREEEQKKSKDAPVPVPPTDEDERKL